MKLLLAALEIEVVQEALELYLRTQTVPIDRRFEYRYRTARAVLEALRQGQGELGTFPRGDDHDPTPGDDDRFERRPARERAED